MKKIIEYLLKFLKDILLFLIDSITIEDIIIIVFFVPCILIFRHLPNIELVNLTAKGILMFGVLIFVALSHIVKSKKKLHEKKEKVEKRENDSTPK